MTRSELDQIVKATCPHCQAGVAARQRSGTQEWVHDFVAPTGGTSASTRQGHSICMASHLRNSDIAKGLTDG